MRWGRTGGRRNRGVPHLQGRRLGQQRQAEADVGLDHRLPVRRVVGPEGRRIRGDTGHSMLGERIASQSEVIGTIVSGYIVYVVGGVPHRSCSAKMQPGILWPAKTVGCIAGTLEGAQPGVITAITLDDSPCAPHEQQQPEVITAGMPDDSPCAPHGQQHRHAGR